MPAIDFAKQNKRKSVPIIALTVRGVERFFLIDTGAEMSVLDAELVDHLRTARTGLVDGAGGRVQASTVHCQFNVLHKTLTEVMRPADNLDRMSQSGGFKLSGILGMDLLGQFSHFTIDNKHRKFRFEL